MDERPAILFLAADPLGAADRRLALDKECADIERELASTPGRSDFAFHSKWAVSVDDLFRHLNEYEPRVVHFSGHGKSEGIVLAGEDSRPQLVPGDALAKVIAAAGRGVQLVVLNACYSAKQATALRKVVDCTIGMKGTIGDKAARSFAVRFYGAIGHRKSVGVAYDQAVAGLAAKAMAGAPHPVVRDGVDAATLYMNGDRAARPASVPTTSGAVGHAPRPAGPPAGAPPPPPPASLFDGVVLVGAGLGPTPRWLGTGFMVAADKVVTAHHVVVEPSTGRPIADLCVRHGAGPWRREVTVAWSGGAALDVAVLDVPTPRGGGPPADPDAFDAAGVSGGAHWEATGYPKVRQRAPSDVLEQVQGKALTCAPGQTTLNLDVESQPDDWAGLSGAPVVIAGRIHGVVRGVAVGWDSKRITATPVAQFFAEPGFRAAIRLPGESNAAPRVSASLEASVTRSISGHQSAATTIDHVAVYDALARLTDPMFERILLQARLERGLFSPPSAPIATRALDVARHAEHDAALRARLWELIQAAIALAPPPPPTPSTAASGQGSAPDAAVAGAAAALLDERVVRVQRELAATLRLRPSAFARLAARLGCELAEVPARLILLPGHVAAGHILAVHDEEPDTADGDANRSALASMLYALLPFVSEWRDELAACCGRLGGHQDVVEIRYRSDTIAEAVMAGWDGRPCHFEHRSGAEPFGVGAVQIPATEQTTLFASEEHLLEGVVTQLARQLGIRGLNARERRTRVASALKVRSERSGSARMRYYFIFRDEAAAQGAVELWRLARDTLHATSGLPTLTLVRMKGALTDDESDLEQYIAALIGARPVRS